jgi:ankyrin repeat protein
MDDIQSYLSQGVSPDAADIEGRTALFFAAANGHLEIVDVLLGKEAVSTELCSHVLETRR